MHRHCLKKQGKAVYPSMTLTKAQHRSYENFCSKAITEFSLKSIELFSATTSNNCSSTPATNYCDYKTKSCGSCQWDWPMAKYDTKWSGWFGYI